MSTNIITRSSSNARRRVRRKLIGGATAFASCLTLWGGFAAANGGASGSISGVGAGARVVVDGSSAWAGLINLATGDGSTVPTYCIDLHTPTSVGVPYTEWTWGSAAVANVAQVASVLHHGYPTVDVVTLGSLVGAPITAAQAAAGTQLAIWSFSDGMVIDRTNAPEVLAVADYLVSVAGAAGEPAPSLHVTPFWSDGVAGDRVGPFTVSTTASQVTVTVSSGVAVDASGAPVSVLGNGDEFFVVGSDAGEVSVEVSGVGVVSTGRVFVTSETSQRQKLIAASTVSVPVRAVSTVSLAAAPTTTTPAEVTTTTAADAPTTTTAPAEVTTTAAPAEVTTTTAAAEVATTAAPAVTSTVEYVDVAGPVVPAADDQAPVAVAGSLPVTGSDPVSMLAAAAALLGLGGGSVIAVRRRR